MQPIRMTSKACESFGTQRRNFSDGSLLLGFFAGLSGIKSPYSFVPGFTLRSDIKMITERSDIARLIAQFTADIGKVEYNYLVNMSDAVVFSRYDVDVDCSNPAGALNAHLIRRLIEIQMWLSTMWLIKDHAINIETGWLVAMHNDEPAVVCNNWGGSLSKADGSRDTTVVSRQEIEDAAGFVMPHEDFNEIIVELNPSDRPTKEGTKLSTKPIRYQRFMYLIAAARYTVDVAMKIVLYCSGLEAIFSSSQAELSYQVAERAAFALDNRGENCLATFRIVKAGYAMRSRAVHGASFKANEMEMLRQKAQELDGIARKVAFRYLSDERFRAGIDIGDSSAFNDLWLHQIFLDPGPSEDTQISN